MYTLFQVKSTKYIHMYVYPFLSQIYKMNMYNIYHFSSQIYKMNIICKYSISQVKSTKSVHTHIQNKERYETSFDVHLMMTVGSSLTLCGGQDVKIQGQILFRGLFKGYSDVKKKKKKKKDDGL